MKLSFGDSYPRFLNSGRFAANIELSAGSWLASDWIEYLACHAGWLKPGMLIAREDQIGLS